MKIKSLRITSIILLVALSAAVFPQVVHAQLGISSIQPSNMQFGSGTTITVQGTDFVNGASVVILNGYGALATTFQNTTVLTAVVPSNIPVGTYDVTVSTGAESITHPGGFTVNPLPPPTNTPPPFTRPQFAVYTSRLAGTVRTNSEVTLKVVMENVGLATAYNTQAAFSSSDLTPTKTGGIAIVGNVLYDQEVDVGQTFYVSGQISGAGVIVVDMTLTYYDSEGASYSDKFTLSIPVSGTTAPSGPAAPTATPTGVKSSQLVITGYSSDVEPLQPGAQFGLNLKVQNVGNADAQRITMIVGGGSGGSSDNGTPVPGGVSGGSGDFANFAPVGASNVQSLGNLKAGEQVQALQSLIVNVSTNPGAYPMRITFSYLNDKNEVVNDEQVITLLVYSLPNVDVSFYRPLDPFYAGQPGALPIQVVNIGKRSTVFGNIKVESAGGIVENGTSLVGSLEAGGYFTLDSLLIPDQPGTVTLNFTIDYVDDFNEPRTITKSIEVEVMEAFIDPSLDPSLNGGGMDMGEGGFPPMTEETVWQKIWRFILGLFGLDSSGPTETDPGLVPPSEGPIVQPIPGKG
jgi:hypothetical protein